MKSQKSVLEDDGNGQLDGAVVLRDLGHQQGLMPRTQSVTSGSTWQVSETMVQMVTDLCHLLYLLWPFHPPLAWKLRSPWLPSWWKPRWLWLLSYLQEVKGRVPSTSCAHSAPTVVSRLLTAASPLTAMIWRQSLHLLMPVPEWQVQTLQRWISNEKFLNTWREENGSCPHPKFLVSVLLTDIMSCFLFFCDKRVNLLSILPKHPGQLVTHY